MTKTFTCSLLCKAISEGRLTIDDQISQCIKLPKGYYYPTIRKLVTHTSGYKRYYFDKQIMNRSTNNKIYEYMGIRIDSQGIGWMLDKKDNLIWHNGGTSNFNSYIAFDKDRQIGVIILSNLSPSFFVISSNNLVNLCTFVITFPYKV